MVSFASFLLMVSRPRALRHVWPPTRTLIWHESCFGKLIMPLLTIVLVIVAVGVLLWALNSFIPMDGKIRSILNVVVVVLLVLWLLQSFGILGSVGGIRIR